MFTGVDLINTFHNLGINTGNVNKLTIDSWFDTDNKELLDILNFITANFQQENVLSPQEQEEYEDLLESKNILYGQEYENSLREIESDFPGILDWKTNEINTENKKDELELLVEEEGDLEASIEVNRTINKNITKTINQIIKDTTNWEMRRRNAEQKCVELGESLDSTRNKLHKQISCYAQHLNGFENSACPVFLSNVSVKRYEQYVTEIKSCFNLMANDTITSMIPHLQNSGASSESADNLEILRERIFSSKKYLLYKQIELEQLNGEIQFMETLNINRLILLSYNNDDSSQVNFEATTFSFQMKWEHFLLSAEDCLKRIADMMVDKPKISVIRNGIHNDRKKLQRLHLQHEIITKICSLQKLYYILLEKENTDIKATDTFFREIYIYITKNLAERELCIKSMLQLTDEYEVYKNLPVQKKYKIFDLLKQFYLNEEQNEESLVAVIRNFWSKVDNACSQTIDHQISRMEKPSKELLLQIGTVQRFLTTGPTSKISVNSLEAYDYIDKITEIVKMQGIALKTAMSTLSNAKKRLTSEKWFKFRRQLWMWFITDPKKVLQIIDEVQVAVKSARKNVI